MSGGVRGLTDELLARELQQGSEAALESLVHRYHRQVHAYLYHLTGDGPTADDLTQEAFIRLCTTYHYPDSFRAWVYAVAHNLCPDHAKSAYQRRVVPGERPPDPGGPSPLDLLERQVERQAVVDALAGLPGTGRWCCCASITGSRSVRSPP